MNETSPRSEIRVKTIDASDVIQLIRLADETNLSPWTYDDFLTEIKNSDAILLKLLSAENEILGFVVGRTVPGSVSDNSTDAELYNIAIHRPDQGQGLGQILLNAFLKECRSRSVGQVWLEVRESNRKAANFYQKNDFRHIQTRPNFYRDPVENALLMRLSLKNETA